LECSAYMMCLRLSAITGGKKKPIARLSVYKL
jgi:hypothetical protein